MAYLLRFDGVDDRVSFSNLSIASGSDFVIEFRAEAAVNENFLRPIGSGSSSATISRVLVFGGGTVRLSDEAGNNYEWSTGKDITTISEYKFSRVAGSVELYLDGVLQSGGFSGNTSSFAFGHIGAHGPFNPSETAFDFYWAKFSVSGAEVAYYDPSASSGTGSTLPDTVGTNDGTLVNFPTDDSQWVYYDDGSSATPTLTAKITGVTATSAVPVIDVNFP